MASIRSTLKEKLSFVTSHGHKEITNGARKQHDNLVVDLTRQLHEYFDPFLDGPARNLKIWDGDRQKYHCGPFIV